MSTKIKVLLADDHFVVRMGLAAVIGVEREFLLVGEATDGLEAVAQAAAHSPDVIVMDLMMPNLNGVQATERIVQRNPSAKVIILTSYGSTDDVARALDAGACGALTKDASHDEIISAIRSAAQGGRPISPFIEKQLVTRTPLPNLSARQHEIMTYIAKGLRNHEISSLLGITPDCVKAHVQAAIAKLGATSRPEAVAIAIERNLIQR